MSTDAGHEKAIQCVRVRVLAGGKTGEPADALVVFHVQPLLSPGPGVT